jgi:hypothetical protein
MITILTTYISCFVAGIKKFKLFVYINTFKFLVREMGSRVTLGCLTGLGLHITGQSPINVEIVFDSP